MKVRKRKWGSITKRGEKYYARYTDADGVRRWKVAGTRKREAIHLLENIRDQVEAQRPGHARRRRPLTIFRWWDLEYCAVLASRLTPGGMRTAQSHVQRLVNWLHEIGNEDQVMADVTRGDAERFVAYLAGEGLQPGYIVRVIGTIRHAWVDAMARGLAPENPWSALRLRRPRPTEVPWVAPAELVNIYGALRESARAHLTLIGETGLRVGEALALRRDDIDLDRMRLFVREGKTAAARRTVPLTPRAAALLRELLEVRGRAADHVLRRISHETLRRALTAACEAVGLARFTPHKLRHVYASHLVQTGVPAPTVAALIGHADGGALVLKLYGRWMPHDAEQRAVNTLTAIRTPATSKETPVQA